MTNGELIQTNDVVTLHADGSFAWQGRLDNVINSGGVKVFVESVEAKIERILAELDAEPHAKRWQHARYFLAPLADERLGETVALILEGAPLSANEETVLLTTLRAALGPYEAPRHIRYVPAFLQTPTGKIDRGTTAAQLASA